MLRGSFCEEFGAHVTHHQRPRALGERVLAGSGLVGLTVNEHEPVLYVCSPVTVAQTIFAHHQLTHCLNYTVS